MQCNVEDLEKANDAQLFEILNELKKTNFFKNFLVDLDQTCPLKKEPDKKPETEQEPEEIIACASEGLPDVDDDAGPACALQEEDPFSAFGSGSSGGGMSTSTAASFNMAMSPPKPKKNLPVVPETVESETTSTPDSTVPAEDEFECDGGKDLDLDEDAEPLCTLNEDQKRSTPIQDFIATALQTIYSLGFESEAQRQTYQWNKQTNKIIVSDAKEDCCEGGDCSNPMLDSFWQDMCVNIKEGDTTKVVNLLLNPERNTGYNGTHIWNAIYQENCLAVKEDEMCYEERVMHRLLSGLHTSTTLSIVKHYYPPSKRKNRVNWEPNPELFMAKFEDNPDYLRNLHFSYVVLLRALRKASDYLYAYPISTGHTLEDQTATVLLKRLLDSAILTSCQPVFSAFDETLMFSEDVESENVISLKQNFKGVFHNISSILDCVQCQQCKLHGKMAMLGYGTALKILFMNDISLERNEVVAFINTIAKFSESMKEVREMTNLYWNSQSQESKTLAKATRATTVAAPPTETPIPASIADYQVDLVDTAVGLTASLARGGHLSYEREAELIRLALQRNSDLLILAKHYAGDVDKFLAFSAMIDTVAKDDTPDAIIIGSGLAGLAAALNILDRGGKVVVIEKEHRLGGNSNKASSGINACCPQNATYGDFLESFKNDTIRSAGAAAQPELIEVLVGKSAEAVIWLKERVGVDLSLMAQLGGHSHKRTHRPSNGMAGAEIIYGMQKAVKAYEKTGMVKILVDTRVTQLMTDESGRVIGVQFKNLMSGNAEQLMASNVVLATGGFAADRSTGSYLEKYRPELVKMPATAGEFSTGDGVTLATSLGAGTIDMDKVQIHPTGWIDPADPTNKSKILAAELMRGVGGMLVNKEGKRFCNELGTRAYVTDKMLQHNEGYAKTGTWDKESPIEAFSLVLASSAAEDGKKHVDLYTHKGLLTKIEGLYALSKWMGVKKSVLRKTMLDYQQSAEAGVDEWGKVEFRGIPKRDLDNETFYAGTVTPVLHYCMGGITIDPQGNVLTEDGQRIEGLHAAGEVTG
jgi:flavocytochrome c